MNVVGDGQDFIPIYKSLSAGAIKTATDQAIHNLKGGFMVGEHVMRTLIPNYYLQKHNIQTLYVVKLPQQWRMTYSLHVFRKGQVPQVLILELMNHKSYNKRFGYFKKSSH